MATWVPINGLAIQLAKNASGAAAADYYLKFYDEGTTTPASMATDSTGGTTLDKCKLDANGLAVNGSDDPFIPHIDRNYKLVCYTNATDADNNATGSAFFVIDNIKLGSAEGALYTPEGTNPTTVSIATYLDKRTLDDIAALRAYEPVVDEDQVFILGHTTEGLGGGTFYYDESDITTADDNGTVIVTPGGARWKRPASESIDVTMFGALGDGVTDDRLSIQAAIDAGAASIYFPKGTYLVSDSIYPASNQMLFGEGFQSILKASAKCRIIEGAPDYVFGGTSGGRENVVIRDMKIDGGGQTTDVYSGVPGCVGIYYSRIDGLLIENVWVTNCGTMNAADPLDDSAVGGFGIRIEARNGPLKNIRIHNCRVTYIAGASGTGDGISVNGYWPPDNNAEELTDVVVSNCYASTIGKMAYTFGGGDGGGSILVGGHLLNCYAEKTGLTGFDSEDSRQNVIANNIFDSCGNDQYYYDPVAEWGATNRLMGAIALTNDCNEIIISNNIFRNNCYYGITCGGSKVQILGNHFTDGATTQGDITDLLAGGMERSIISNNWFSNVVTFPTNFQLFDSIVSSNYITGDLLIVDCDNFTLTDNYILGAVSVGQGSNQLKITNNTIQGFTSAPGIHFTATHGTGNPPSANVIITGNTLLGDSTQKGMQFGRDQFEDGIISNNIISSVTDGIYFDNMDDADISSISNNRIDDFSGHGIYLNGYYKDSGINISDNSIKANTLTATYGIRFPNISVNTNDAIITGNNINNCGDGIVVIESGGALFDNAIIRLNNVRTCTTGITVPANSNSIGDNIT